MTFDYAVQKVLAHEGGARFTENPNDPGGATKYGISIRFAGSVNLDLDGDGKTTRADIIALDEAHASALYRDHFWLPLQCGRMPVGIDYAVFDCGVNQGVGAAARLLQRALRVSEDGKIGPATLGKLAGVNDRSGLLSEFMAQRNTRYARLAAESDRAMTFILGWLRRSADVHATAQRMMIG